MMFAFKKPIRDPSENSLMMCALAVTFFNLLIGAVSRIPTEGVLLSVDAYMDHDLFTVLVIGANVLVIGILVCKHLFIFNPTEAFIGVSVIIAVSRCDLEKCLTATIMTQGQ